MHTYSRSAKFLGAVAATVIALCAAQRIGLSQSSMAERAAEIRKFSDEIQMRTNDDARRISKEYAREHLTRVRELTQQQVLETLSASDRPADISKAMNSVLGPDRFGGSPEVFAADLAGVKAIVAGYDRAYGPQVTPDVAVMIDGYRKTGLNYELADAVGSGLEGCILNLTQLASPRSNEMWLLARGYLAGASTQRERMRIYSFDGYKFAELWSTGEQPLTEPVVKVNGGEIAISYRDSLTRVRQVLRLTDAGVIASEAAPEPPAGK